MLMTPWGEHLDENCILTEYPRPQMRRNSYLNLNGRWEYAITDSDESPRHWDGTILVPFSPESALSGVGRSLQPGQTLWYRREVIVPQGFIPAVAFRRGRSGGRRVLERQAAGPAHGGLQRVYARRDGCARPAQQPRGARA